jgi:hypothetical protein
MQARRTVSGVIAISTAATLVASGLALAKGEMDFTVVERATTDTVIDVGDTGDSIGDMLAFGNDLYDADNSAVVGRDQGQCFRSNPGMAWECVWTNILEDGSITVEGPFYDDLRDVDLAITGGTGAYAGAGGLMTLHSRDEAGTELDFTFHVQLDDGSAPTDDDTDDMDDAAAASPAG